MLIYVNIEEKNLEFFLIMLIHVKIIKKFKKKFETNVNFMITLCKNHRQTDRQTHQKHSSEPHKREKKYFIYVLLFAHLRQSSFQKHI
jgi:hypothetical protein